MSQTSQTYQAAHGRWREILIAVGIDQKFLTGRAGPCPLCNGTDRFTFDDRTGEGDYICRGCDAGKGFTLVMKFKGWDFKTAAREVDQILGRLPDTKPQAKPQGKQAISSSELNRIWGGARMILPVHADPRDPVSKYFERRGMLIDGPSYGRVLRYVPDAWHWPSKARHPAMIAKICDADGKPRHLHTTFLTQDGEKADVDRPRLYTAGGLPKGGAIRLGPESHTMGVAEGIETALSASILYGMPVWATTSALMLEAWQPPAIAKNIIVFGDNDTSFVGQCAAYGLAHRLMNEAERDEIEREVLVRVPAMEGADWNDFLAAKSVACPVSFDDFGEEYDALCAAAARDRRASMN